MGNLGYVVGHYEMGCCAVKKLLLGNMGCWVVKMLGVGWLSHSYVSLLKPRSIKAVMSYPRSRSLDNADGRQQQAIFKVPHSHPPSDSGVQVTCKAVPIISKGHPPHMTSGLPLQQMHPPPSEPAIRIAFGDFF